MSLLLALVSTGGGTTIELTDGSFIVNIQNPDLLHSLLLLQTNFGISTETLSSVLNLTLDTVNFNYTAQDIQTALQLNFNEAGLTISGTDLTVLSALILEFVTANFVVAINTVNVPIVLALNDHTLNQVIYMRLGALGYEGALPERLLQFFLNNGAVSENICDAEREWLEGVSGYIVGTIQDQYKIYLATLGYTGVINESLKKFWANL